MRARRPGFTLIELLIAIVIIGLLAMVAVPHLSRARERSYFKTMMSDLRHVMTQQEMYWSLPSNSYQYAPGMSFLTAFSPSRGVTVSIIASGGTGWGATASHIGLAAVRSCAVFYGTVATVPPPATTAGIVTCTGE